jgi:hydroxymethylglutaryl-CoA reductase
MGENYGEHHLLGNGYRLDLVSVPRAIVLRREDGSEVARFSIWDATSSAIEQAAEKDHRSTREAIAC